MKDLLERVLAEYCRVRKTEKLSRDHWLWSVFRSLQHALQESLPATDRTITVRWSVGQGNWARIPWIAFLAAPFATRVGRGLYVAILFAEDMSGFNLALTQGVSKLMHTAGAKVSRDRLRKRVRQLRHLHRALSRFGFSLEDAMWLGKTKTAADYAMATVAYKFYRRDDTWGEEALTADLGLLLEAYLSSPAE